MFSIDSAIETYWNRIPISAATRPHGVSPRRGGANLEGTGASLRDRTAHRDYLPFTGFLAGALGARQVSSPPRAQFLTSDRTSARMLCVLAKVNPWAATMLGSYG